MLINQKASKERSFFHALTFFLLYFLPQRIICLKKSPLQSLMKLCQEICSEVSGSSSQNLEDLIRGNIVSVIT